MTTDQSRRTSALFAFGVLALLILVGIASNAEQFQAGERRAIENQDAAQMNQRDPAAAAPEPPTVSDPIEPPRWLINTVAIILGIGALYLLSRQRISLRFRRPSIAFARSSKVEVTEQEEAEAIAEFARDLIDELNEGDSPRYAIQRAYAAVETGFGAQELARKPAETPQRYLDRIFGRHATMQDPLHRLTDLFQHARFSPDPVDETMRSSAIAALTEIREYYTSFAWKRISNRRSTAASRSKTAA